MPRTINILPENLANKIAAGEVVQRPASAVKELLENSLDAHATSITIVIKEAGKALIQVTDDGDGMSAEDASIAFARHATSKIATYEDLENIRTLGFRGEALASIAAVSHIELRTRQRSSDVGTKVRIEGGLVLEISEEAVSPGTTITVRNLFYNTPGRRNFLKSTSTEFKHISDTVMRVALSHPELAIQFISDEETILQLRPSPPEDRLKEIFGEKLATTLLSFTERSELATITGFLGKPDFAKKGRTEQYLFLNNRYIVNRSLNHAVYQGYEHLLEKGSFPVFVIFLTIDPHKVDVNVHPAKMEVKFEDESSMYRSVLSAVRKTLSAHDLIPVMGMKDLNSGGENIGVRFRQELEPARPRSSAWEELLQNDSPSNRGGTPSESRPATTMPALNTIDEVFQSSATIDQQLFKVSSGSVAGEAASIWQVHNKYIILPTETGLMIVDQHAAHERVLYERAVAHFNEAHTKSQQLLFPHTLEMTAGDAALVGQLLPLLEGLGFSIKLFGKTTVIVDGVPIDVKPGDEGRILQDVLDLYKEDEQQIKLEPRERLAKSFSCKAAVKAGDPLSKNEMRSLLDQLFGTKIPYSCPHGRPVMLKLSLTELDRRFGRIS